MKTKIFDSLKQASAAMGVPLSVLKWAKANGCPGFRNGRIYHREVSAWLRKHPVKKRATRKPSPVAAPPGASGAAGTLRRLEVSEREAYQAWQGALASDVPDTDTDRLRRGWLDISEALRKADIALEEHRRDAGELVERKLVEQGLWLFHYYVNASWMTNLHQVVAAIQAQPAQTTGELHKLLSDRLQYNVLLSAAAGMAAGDKKVPAWLPRASIAFWEQHPYTKMNASVEAVAEILKEVLATPPAPAKAELRP
jgi:hypothetical protein